MLVKGFTAVLVMFLLGGCSSYVAYEITAQEKYTMGGDTSDWQIENTFCDDDFSCVLALGVGKPANDNIVLTLNFKVNDNHQIWSYKKKDDKGLRLKPLNNQLIFIFSGYGQSAGSIYIHQAWLQHITGAEVFVIPSANQTKSFKFGLDFASPIISEIKRRNPEKVHLIAFSMGAMAAHAVAEKVNNAHLHLIAPMTDFNHSTKAVWNAFYGNEFYSKLISMDTIEEAVQIVYQKSRTSPEDINLVNKLSNIRIPTYIYASIKDKITLASDWDEFNAENIKFKKYDQLNHVEMTALLRQDLLLDFASNLLERKILKNETETIGLMCSADDEVCTEKFDKL